MVIYNDQRGTTFVVQKTAKLVLFFAHARKTGFSKERENVDLVARRASYEGLLFKFVTTYKGGRMFSFVYSLLTYM